MTDVIARARDLADRHASGELVVLPTVWDTWSARAAVAAGAVGLTVGSHPVADAIGRADGENMDLAEYLAVVSRITSAVEVPVSVDVESGYGLPPAELVDRLIEAGAAGANIEDVVHREGGRVRDRREHADYIAAARAAADAAGVDLVVNGRTDAVKLGSDRFEDPLAEAEARMKLMEDAGARSVYPVGLTTAEQVARLVQAVTVPVNVTAHPVNGHGAGDLDALGRLGVRRVSFGPLWQRWLGEISGEPLAGWVGRRWSY